MNKMTKLDFIEILNFSGGAANFWLNFYLYEGAGVLLTGPIESKIRFLKIQNKIPNTQYAMSYNLGEEQIRQSHRTWRKINRKILTSLAYTTDSIDSIWYKIDNDYIDQIWKLTSERIILKMFS
jgi:hypothetical protein